MLHIKCQIYFHFSSEYYEIYEKIVGVSVGIRKVYLKFCRILYLYILLGNKIFTDAVTSKKIKNSY